MRHVNRLAMGALVSSVALFAPAANADRVCERDCVGPVCTERCIETDARRDRDLRDDRRERRDLSDEDRRDRAIDGRDRGDTSIEDRVPERD